MHLRGQQAALSQFAVDLQPLLEQRVLLLAQGVNLAANLLLTLGTALPQLPALLRKLLLQVLQAAGYPDDVLAEGLRMGVGERFHRPLDSNSGKGPER